MLQVIKILISVSKDKDFAMDYLVKSHENTTIWLYAHFQLATVIIALSSFTKFQNPFYNNKMFTIYWIFVFGCMSAMLLIGSGTSFYYAPGVPLSFRAFQFALVLIHLALSVFYERLLFVRYGGEKVPTQALGYQQI